MKATTEALEQFEAHVRRMLGLFAVLEIDLEELKKELRRTYIDIEKAIKAEKDEPS